MKDGEHTTDFTVCGDCSHGSTIVCGIVCDILPDVTPTNGELTPDSPCLIKRLGHRDLSRAISIIIRETNHHIEMIATCHARQYILETYRRNAVPTPLLPDNRAHDHFEVGDPIMFYDSSGDQWRSTAVIQVNRGTIAFAYRQDRNYGGGIGTPTVLRNDEFDYFHAHPDEFKEWLTLTDRPYNGERLPIDAMYQALLDYREEG